MTSKKLSCDCKRSAAFFCLDHNIFLCHNHVSDHSCSIDSLDNFLAYLVEQKERIDKKICSSRDFLIRIVAETAEYNALQIKNIGLSIQNEVSVFDSVYKTTIQRLCQERFDLQIGEFKSQMQLFDDNNFEDFYKQSKANSKDKMTKKLTQIQENVKTFMSNDLVFNNLLLYLNLMLAQLQNLKVCMAKAVKPLANDSLTEAKLLEEIKEILLKDNRFITDVKKQPKPETKQRLSMLVDYVLSLKKEKPKNGLKLEAPRRISKELKPAELPRHSSKNLELPRRTSKELNNLQIAKAFDAVNESLIEKSFSIPESFRENQSTDKPFDLSLRSIQSNLSFEVDDSFAVNDDEQFSRRPTMNENVIAKRFENSQTTLFYLLDKVLYDLSCDGFFDKLHRQSINTYLDLFKTNLDDILMELKNSFNRL